MKKAIIGVVALIIIGTGVYFTMPYKPSVDELWATYQLTDAGANVEGNILNGAYKFNSGSYEVKDGDIYVSTTYKLIGSGYGSFEVAIDSKDLTEDTKFYLIDSEGNTKRINLED